MEYTNDSNNCKNFEDEQLLRLQQNVREIQQNAEVGVKYMQLWEEIAYEKREARKEGLAEGRAEGKAESIITLITEIGVISDSLKEKIFSETNLDILTDWLKKAARATSVKEFEEMIISE